MPAAEAMRPGEVEQQDRRETRWRSFRDVLTHPSVDWSPRAARRQGWRAPLGPERRASRTLAVQGGVDPPDTMRVALLRVDFLADRSGSQTTGNGRFDLSGPDTLQPPIDRAPRNRTFYRSHAEALERYFDAQSYGRTVIETEVWPRDENSAYSVSDMADFGPWAFSQEIFRAAVHMFRTMVFAADSQSIDRFGDPIPWDSIDRVVIIHAGSDFQSDLRQDSPLDIPSFTIGVGDSDVIVFERDTLGGQPADFPLDRAAFIPETSNQDDFYGAINGVLAHECGHLFFGFFDVYDINTGRPIAGYWSLMDSGNLVGSRVSLSDGSEIFATGLLPPSLDPFHRFYAGDGLAFPEAEYGQTIPLRNSQRFPDMRRVTLSSDEFLVLENRWLAPADTVQLDQDSVTRVVLGPKSPDRYEYDALLPGAGMLVWHIDTSVIPLESYFPIDTSLRVNPDFGVNTNPNRLGISVIEADGLGDLGDLGSPYLLGAPFDPFFASNNPTLSDTTSPNLLPNVGTRPHVRLDFPDDPAPTMRFTARRDWARPGFPIRASFPPEGPVLLAIDADGVPGEEVAWAGGAEGTIDSTALFVVHADTTTTVLARLPARPRPEMAAVATGPTPLGGQPRQGPSLFAVSTYPDTLFADTSQGRGRLYLFDHTGAPMPGFPPELPKVTTPPVIVGEAPDAIVVVGCEDGRVRGVRQDGTPVFELALHTAPIHGRLAIVSDLQAAFPAMRIAATAVDGSVAVTPFGILCTGGGPGPDPCTTWRHVVSQPGGAAPGLLWIPFEGRGDPRSGESDAHGVRGLTLVVQVGDHLRAWNVFGQELGGWGRSVGDTLIAALGAGDPDGDGRLEVLTQSRSSEVAFWNASGAPSPGWPERTSSEPFRSAATPLAADVDGDGRSEIVALNASGVLAALRADGRTPDGWPLATGVGVTGSPVVVDFDLDGSLEFVAPDRFGALYAWTAPGTTSAVWPMLGGDARRTFAPSLDRTPVTPPSFAGPFESGTLRVYPNPARRSPVTFAFRLTEPADVEVRILDTSGHEVAAFTRPGVQSDNAMQWEPGALPAGLYLAHVRFRGAGGERTEVRPVAILR